MDMTTFDDDAAEEDGVLWGARSDIDGKKIRVAITPGQAVAEIMRLRLIIDQIQDVLTMVGDDVQKSINNTITPRTLACVKAARAAIDRVKGY